MQENKDFYSFAAANGYCGFKSYFKQVFAPSELSRLYVLKGGPGTGKSSLMKRLLSSLEEKGYRGEAVLCSSDPSSLDGIIVKGAERSIAVIDGTAPHTVDPVFPGARDEIVNLGDNWEKRFLVAQDSEIIDLSTAKARAYKQAYAYLELAGYASKILEDSLRERFDLQKAKRICAEIIPEKEYDTKARTRLFSCFGKSGLMHLDTPNSIAEKNYTVKGDAGELFLTLLADRAAYLSCGAVISPSPLNSRFKDAVYLEDGSVCYKAFGEGEKIDTDSLLNKKTDMAEEKARTIQQDALNEAQRWFNIASDLHARLESIYTASMDFTKWAETQARVLEESENILSGKE